MKIEIKIYIIFFILTFIISVNNILSATVMCSDEINSKKENIKLDKGDENISESQNVDNIENRNKEKTIEKEAEDIEISAENKIEIDKEKGVMIVTGNALVKEGVTSLSADILTAFTCEAKNGDTKIIQVNADKNVVIISDQGKAYADRGIYFIEEKIIELYENVKLEKERDVLVGDKGIFNVLTGKGELSVEPDKQGRKKKVYGIFKSKKE